MRVKVLEKKLLLTKSLPEARSIYTDLCMAQSIMYLIDNSENIATPLQICKIIHSTTMIHVVSAAQTCDAHTPRVRMQTKQDFLNAGSLSCYKLLSITLERCSHMQPSEELALPQDPKAKYRALSADVLRRI